MSSPSKAILTALRDLLLQREGPLTRDLLLEPARFGLGLGLVPERLLPDSTTTMVCGYCSTGCGLDVHLKDGAAVNLSPAANYPVNLGMACPKGWEALTPLNASDRATTPLLRGANGKREAIPWDRALTLMTERFKAIQARHGKSSVAFLSTGQIATEEMAFLGALAKFGMGMVHGDGNTRQCMATSVVAYKQSFGYDAPPYTYADLEESDVIVLIGSNLCIAHPILWERVCRNPRKPEIVVIDPRKTETAMAATRHLAIKPKSDLTLFYGIARRLLDRGAIDEGFIRAHTNGIEQFQAHVQDYTSERVCRETGLTSDELEGFAELLQSNRRVSFWWTMGVNQSHEGVRTAQAIINLALMTGNIGRRGTGANSITGQCNAMGSRLFSNTTNLFGGRDFTKEKDRADVARILGIDGALIPDQNSLAYDQIIEGILSKKIHGLWIVGTNPAHSWINQEDLLETLGRLDFLVVQDMYSTAETAERADLLLPAAGWGEKEGTFINSERRIGVLQKVARAPGQALADFHIFQLVAEAWGCSDMFRDWRSPKDVFEILKRLSEGLPCDISGIRDYAALAEAGGIQWPFPAIGNKEQAKDQDKRPANSQSQERRLFEDGRFYHSDGRARFCFESTRAMPELPSRDYPFLLLTGRGSSSQWHTQTRTSKSAVLRKLAPQELYVEISPVDARALGIAPGELVNLVSQRAEVRARAFITHTVRTGEVFVPMHFATVNKLTFPAFDPYSRQPAYKACAVAIQRLEQSEIR